MYAVRNGDLPLVKHLFSAGALAMSTNAESFSAADFSSDKEILDLLLEMRCRSCEENVSIPSTLFSFSKSDPKTNEPVLSEILLRDCIAPAIFADKINRAFALENGLKFPWVEKDSFGRTTLFFAVMRGDLESVKSLLEQKHDPNIRDRFGRSPLFYALDRSPEFLESPFTKKMAINDLKMVQLLLEHKADVNFVDITGETPLFCAERRPPEFLRLLIPFATKNTINRHAPLTRHTVLMTAAQKCDFELLKLLLGAGADPNLMDRDYATPLIFLLCSSRRSSDLDPFEPHPNNPSLKEVQEGVQLLLSAGAGKTVKASFSENTVLLNVLHHNSPELVDTILKAGADVNFSTGEYCAFSIAIRGSVNPEIVTRLLRSPERNKDSTRRALKAAVEFADLRLLKEIIASAKEPIDFNAVLFDAVLADGKPELFAALLDAGGNPDAVNAEGIPLLSKAIQNRRFLLATELLRKKAKPDFRDMKGRTPLMYLLQSKPDFVYSPAVPSPGGPSNPKLPPARDPAGLDALLELLLAAGADWNAQDRTGKTVEAFAKENKYGESFRRAVEKQKKNPPGTASASGKK